MSNTVPFGRCIPKQQKSRHPLSLCREHLVSVMGWVLRSGMGNNAIL